MSKNDYTLAEVRKYLDIYGKMVHQSYIWAGGVTVKEHRAAVEETIQMAKNEFPEELKDEKFENILNDLEKILKR